MGFLVQRAMEPVFPDPTESDVDPLVADRLTGIRLWHKVHTVILHAALHGQNVPVAEIGLQNCPWIGVHAISTLQRNPELTRGAK